MNGRRFGFAHFLTTTLHYLAHVLYSVIPMLWTGGPTTVLDLRGGDGHRSGIFLARIWHQFPPNKRRKIARNSFFLIPPTRPWYFARSPFSLSFSLSLLVNLVLQRRKKTSSLPPFLSVLGEKLLPRPFPSYNSRQLLRENSYEIFPSWGTLAEVSLCQEEFGKKGSFFKKNVFCPKTSGMDKIEAVVYWREYPTESHPKVNSWSRNSIERKNTHWNLDGSHPDVNYWSRSLIKATSHPETNS